MTSPRRMVMATSATERSCGPARLSCPSRGAETHGEDVKILVSANLHPGLNRAAAPDAAPLVLRPDRRASHDVSCRGSAPGSSPGSECDARSS